MRPLREKIQIIFQDPYASLNPKKKIVQSVMAPLDVAGKYTKEEKLEKVRKILREVGLSDKYLEKYPHEIHFPADTKHRHFYKADGCVSVCPAHPAFHRTYAEKRVTKCR